MLPHQLERVRTKAADMMKAFLIFTRRVFGTVSVAHAAKGALDEVAAALVSAYGEREAYRIMTEAAEAIIDRKATADLYLSACLGGIIQAAKKAK